MVILSLTNFKRGDNISDKRENKRKKEAIVVPGFNDRKFGEDAVPEDIKKGNYTKVTRVYLDENDPS